jgi:hypothetical protein
MIEFRAWPKIARLYRDIVITEKIDGTNGAVGIEFGCLEEDFHYDFTNGDSDLGVIVDRGGFEVNGLHNVARVYAQARKRVITPKEDNHGFAAWVWDNAEALVDALGVGLHFGEWWGGGINRGYWLPKGEHRFSLFNTSRWAADTNLYVDGFLRVPELSVVPTLYQGEFSTLAVAGVMEQLRLGGSVAEPQYMNPEGIVVFHTAANTMFKATLENDEMPKTAYGLAA